MADDLLRNGHTGNRSARMWWSSATARSGCSRCSPPDGKFLGNITIAVGPATTQTLLRELVADILDGRIEPGRVFDRTIGLDDVPEGYRAMNDREALKIPIRP
jgi:threonine dehydrogenase-like Zn-dependent dehydrogenase